MPIYQERPEAYWKFTELRGGFGLRGFLQAGRWAPTWEMSEERLREKSQRMQHGLLDYDVCATLELEQFVRDRGLRLPPKGRQEQIEIGKTGTWRKSLVNQLEQADDGDALKFSKFLDLPVELQKGICELYMDFKIPRRNWALPPLTRVSRYLRRITLPLIFGTKRFEVRFLDERPCTYTSGHIHGFGSSCSTRVFQFEKATSFWLTRLSPDSLGSVKHLLLSSRCLQGIEIDLDHSVRGFTVTMKGHGWGFSEFERQVKCELDNALEEVCWEGGARRFRMEDMDRLVKALGRAYEAAKLCDD